VHNADDQNRDFAVLDRLFSLERQRSSSTPLSSRFTRRRLLLGASFVAGGAAAGPHLLDLCSEQLSLHYSGNRLVATLSDLVWTISTDHFAEGARLKCSAARGTYRIKLINARLPGTNLFVDFQAQLERRFGRWHLAASFNHLGLEFEVRLRDWLAGITHVIKSARSQRLLAFFQAFGISIRPDDDWRLAITPEFRLRLSSSSKFKMSAHGVDLSVRAIDLKIHPIDELKALTLSSEIDGHVGTRIVFEDAHPLAGTLRLGEMPDKALAVLQSVEVSEARLEVGDSRRGVSSIVVVNGRASLSVEEPNRLAARFGELVCDNFMLAAHRLRGHTSLTLVASIPNEPQLVRAREAAFLVTPLPNEMLRVGATDGSISRWLLRTKAESLSLPLQDVDIATLNFSDTAVDFRLFDTAGPKNKEHDSVARVQTAPDGEATVLLVGDLPLPRPNPNGPIYPLPSEEPRIVVGLNAEGGIDAPLQRASLRVLRARDLLDLTFGFRDFKLVAKAKQIATLVPILDGPAYDDPAIQRPLLIVNFPPQNLAQRAFLRQLNKSDQPAVACGAGSSPLQYTVEIDLDTVVEKAGETREEAVERTRGERDPIYQAIYQRFKALGAGSAGLKWYNGGEGVTDRERKEAADVLTKLIEDREAFPRDKAVEARLSGPSRLVFEFQNDIQPKSRGGDKRSKKTKREIPFSIAGLTNWRGLKLVVVKRANRPKLTLDEQLKYLGFRQTRDWRERMNDVVRSIVPPGETETLIEAQIRLFLSPDEYAVWETSDTKPVPGEPVPLWRSRLSPESQSSVRVIGSPDFYDGVLNAGGSPPDYGDKVPWPVPDARTKPYAEYLRLPLSVRDRHELVMLSSGFGVPILAPQDPNQTGKSEARSSVIATPEAWALYETVNGKSEKIADQGIYDPLPLKRAVMALTSQGILFRGEGTWEPPASVLLKNKSPIWPALSVERWNHLTFLGSDIEVEVAYKGYLCPLAVRATLVKRTETRYYCHPRWHAPVAYSIQRLFCEVEKEPKTYAAVGQPDLGRDWTPKALKFVTTRTPDLVDPFDATGPTQKIGSLQTNVYSGGRIDLGMQGRGLAFFPRVHSCLGNEFKFIFKVPTEEGDITAPLIFIDNTGAHDRQFVEKLALFYRSLLGEIDKPDDHIQLRVARHTGSRRRYADVRRDGDTDFETNWWLLNLRGRPDAAANEAWYMDGVLEGADQPPFFPITERAGIKVQSLDRLLGRSIPEIQVSYDKGYVKNGFDSAKNPAEIYLNILSPEVQLDVSRQGQATGGLAKPNSRIVSLSRVTGPVGGSASTAIAQAQPLPLMRIGAAGDPIAIPPETAAARNNTFSGSEVFGGALKKAKLLGLISLEDIVKIAKYTDAAPKLVERFEYGARAAEQAIRKKLEAIAPQLAEQIQTLTDAADEALERAFGEKASSHPFHRWYPGLGDALERLRDLLIQPLSTATSIFQRVTEIVEAGKVVLAEFDRVRRNPAPTVLSDFIAELQQSVDRVRNLALGQIETELNQLITRVVVTTNEQLADFCSDLIKPFAARLLGSNIASACSDVDVTKPETFSKLFERMEDALYRETIGRALLDGTRAIGEIQHAARSEISKLPERLLHATEKTLDAVIELDRVVAFARGLNAGEINQLCTNVTSLALDLVTNVVDIGEKGAGSLSKRIEQLNSKIVGLPKGIVSPEIQRATEAMRAQLAQALQRIAAVCVEIQNQRAELKRAAVKCTNLAAIADPTQNLMRLRWQAIEHVRDLVKQLVDNIDLTIAEAWPPSERMAGPATPAKAALQRRFADDKQVLRLQLISLLELITPIFRDLTSVAAVVTKQPFDFATVKSRVEAIRNNYTPKYLADIEAQTNAVVAQATKLENDSKVVFTTLSDARQRLAANPNDAAALRSLRMAGNAAVELLRYAGVYSAEFDRKLTAMALPAMAFANSAISDVQKIQMKLDERGRAFAAALGKPLQKVHAEAAAGLAAIKMLLDDPANTALNKIVGHQLQPLLDSTEIRRDGDLFGTLYTKAIGKKVEDESVVGAPASFDEVVAVVRAIAERWRAQRPALLQRADALASIVDALTHGNLSRIVDFGALERELREKLQQFLPTRVTLDYTFESDLNDLPNGAPVFAINRDPNVLKDYSDLNNSKDLTIRSEVIIDLRDMTRTFQTRGVIKPFIINIPGASTPPAELVSLIFSPARFAASDSSSSSFNVKVREVKIGSILEYVQKLQAWMNPGSGPYVKPIFDPLGIEAGFRVSFPQIPIGPMQLVNIAFSIACALPFEEEEARFRFAFCDRQRPFLIVYPPYGGGGFAGFVASAKGIVGFDAGFEFGAVIPIQFGPLKAQGRVTAGIYISRSGNVATIEGFVQAVGEGTIACFTISVFLIVGVRSVNGNMYGYSTFSVSFKVGFAEISYSFTATYTMKGSSGSSAARLLAAKHDDSCAGKPTLIVRNRAKYLSRSYFKQYKSYFDFEAA
jgi:hypothetical protein